ncbi:MAG: hypothetical protein JAZ05_03915, partial [Candidatus Thiodiazotropha taylori]|nr:hypothetical protein [Candidatus Thiodiazotropha taylori]MCW4291156.1 hypothetical protein [Candidatus Thiodiazotropha taylori]
MIIQQDTVFMAIPRTELLYCGIRSGFTRSREYRLFLHNFLILLYRIHLGDESALGRDQPMASQLNGLLT